MVELENKIKRKFIIGSEWLTYKLYMGTKTADDFIKNHLPLVTEDLVRENNITNWFFIRYNDPDYHLRVRFYLPDKAQLAKTVQVVHDKLDQLVNSQLIHKVVIDTYSRELERYGKHTINESEHLFGVNSKTIIKALKLSDEDENKRWLLGLKTLDVLLEGFNYNLKEKRDFLFQLKEDYGKEFGVNKSIRKQLSLKFRNHRAQISQVLENEFHDYFNEDLFQYNDLYRQILAKNQDSFKVNINELMYSYVHMHCNRLFSSKHRMNEWVLYDMLYQYYYSTYARNQASLKKG